MVDKKTEQLTAAGTLTGTEMIPIVQGANSRRTTLNLLKAFVGTGSGAGLADVNNYLLPGDTNYDGAISRCMTANNFVYFPAKPTLSDPNNYYHTTQTITINSNQGIEGAGPGLSKIVCDIANVPVVTLGPSLYWYKIANLTLAHVVTATAGGDGIFQAQGATYWVDTCIVENVQLVGNYNGANLGKAFSGHWKTVISMGNQNDGFLMTTNGASLVNGVAQPGPLQTIFLDCAAAANGNDGFSYKSTGSIPAGSSLGTLINCVTYANEHHGVSAIGLSGHPLHSVRIEGGFYGEDLGQGIYLDTYGGNHSLCPQMVELSGQYNIYLTSHNDGTYIRMTQCTGAYFDGILNLGATNTVIDGGQFVNNGRAGGAPTYCAIRIDGGSATINGIRARDTGSGLQDYGISVTGDNVLINGCNLVDNAIDAIVWTTGPTNSLVTGCLPTTANSGGAGTTITGNLTVTGNITANGNISTSTGDVIGKRVSAGPIPGGASTSINAVYATSMVATTAFTLSTASGQFDASAGGSLVVRDAVVNRSLGVGTGASSVTGRIDAATVAASSTLSTGGSFSVSGALSAGSLSLSGAITGVTSLSMTSTLNLNSSGNISGIVNMGIVGDVTMTTGSLYLNGTGAGQGGIVAQSAKLTGALGVGTDPSSTAGRIDATNGVYDGATRLT